MSYQADYRYQGGRPSRNVRDVVNSDYRAQYNGAVQEFFPQQGRRNWHVAPSRRQYNMKRAEQMRVNKGKGTMKQVSEALDANWE
jgi:hypothetical protein